jgi:SWIM zinc finger
MSFSESQVAMVNTFLRKTSIEESNERSKESVLHQISFILWDHDHLLSNCLELLDDDRTEIRRIKSATTSRVFWKVPSQSFRGAQQRDYTCTEKFCSCRSFSEMARTTTSEILCKHLLAVRIGTALNMIVEQVVPDNLFADLMCD